MIPFTMEGNWQELKDLNPRETGWSRSCYRYIKLLLIVPSLRIERSSTVLQTVAE